MMLMILVMKLHSCLILNFIQANHFHSSKSNGHAGRRILSFPTSSRSFISKKRKERFFRMPVWKQGSNHMNMSQGPTYITGNQIMESHGLRFNSKSWSHKYSDSSQGHFNCSFQKPGIPGSRPDCDRTSAEYTLEQSARHIALFPPLNYFLLMFWVSCQGVLLGAFT